MKKLRTLSVHRSDGVTSVMVRLLHLQDYINRLVGVKLLQHSLHLRCCAAKFFYYNRRCLHSFQLSSFLVQLRLDATMARIRSTARLTNEGREAKATETAPISEIIKNSKMIA
jgi:hypothetical protein